jgi:hypothetical protein
MMACCRNRNLSVCPLIGHRSQHIFVDSADPSCDYRLAYNVVGCADNQRTFNDGYHIQHHLNSRLHWSELPRRFKETLDEHTKHDGEAAGRLDGWTCRWADRWMDGWMDIQEHASMARWW